MCTFYAFDVNVKLRCDVVLAQCDVVQVNVMWSKDQLHFDAVQV